MDKGAKWSHCLVCRRPLGPLFFSTAYCLHVGPGALKSRGLLDEHLQRVNLQSSASGERRGASNHSVFTLPGTPRTFHPRAAPAPRVPDAYSSELERGPRQEEACSQELCPPTPGAWAWAHSHLLKGHSAYICRLASLLSLPLLFILVARAFTPTPFL